MSIKEDVTNQLDETESTDWLLWLKACNIPVREIVKQQKLMKDSVTFSTTTLRHFGMIGEYLNDLTSYGRKVRIPWKTLKVYFSCTLVGLLYYTPFEFTRNPLITLRALQFLSSITS